MVNWIPVSFIVGQSSKADKSKISLEGIISREKSSKSRIVVVLGLNSGFQGYMPFLNGLADHYNVATYNQRGQKNSKVEFNPPMLSEDLDSVLESLGEGRNLLLAHSAGSIAVANSKLNPYPYFLITPCFGDFSFSSLYQLGLSASRIKNLPYFKEFTNQLLGNEWNPNFMEGASSLLSSPTIIPSNIPVGYCVSDRDEALGTLGNPDHYLKSREILRKIYPSGHDFSERIKGLNHCLNRNSYDFSYFLKNEEGKDSFRIIKSIVSFFDNLDS
ncbi:hypothetical protein COU57_02805 [Candidatus Pacearchaeota archaeon CG10_big_fil_rev_8_21_14_0_10_32_14]|nr:MAG: hypothetical protein COU57_02805 [Candidatus Pacearchaeota archaeon CG10_big_fil_rev_8_21_14_0_10_32_14]